MASASGSVPAIAETWGADTRTRPPAALGTAAWAEMRRRRSSRRRPGQAARPGDGVDVGLLENALAVVQRDHALGRQPDGLAEQGGLAESRARVHVLAVGAAVQRDRDRIVLPDGEPANIVHGVPSFAAFRRSVLINREGTPPSSSTPSTTSGYSSMKNGTIVVRPAHSAESFVGAADGGVALSVAGCCASAAPPCPRSGRRPGR
jgi:hypothetical protein